MVCFGLVVADDAYNGHAIELPEGVCHVALLLKLLLAVVAPCLKIIWIATVLDEPCRSWLRLQHVLTDNRRYAFSVRAAVNHHWLSSCHVSCAA